MKEGAVLIDVGINHIPDESKPSGYRLVGLSLYIESIKEGGTHFHNKVGDISPEAHEVASLYTPVPGGVGPMTVASLVHNTLYCAAQKHKLLPE